jgi:hypothetical protein
MRSDATSELAELLRLAQSAANRVQADTDGEAFQVAARISQHVQYLRKVVDLLRHEIERIEDPQASLRASAGLELLVR